MKALIAFIVMAAVILTLIEFNERRKAKKHRDSGMQVSRNAEDCAETACTDCALSNTCEKKQNV